MKLKFSILIYILNILIIVKGLRLRTTQPPFADNKYRQASVPPIITASMVVPAYGNKELFKWQEFVQANANTLAEVRTKKKSKKDNFFKNRMKRIAKLEAYISK